jgi:Flp pilus assembly protein TadG
LYPDQETVLLIGHSALSPLAVPLSAFGFVEPCDFEFGGAMSESVRGPIAKRARAARVMMVRVEEMNSRKAGRDFPCANAGCHRRLARSVGHFLRRFWRGERGSAIVEFAFVAPVFLLLLCMIIENGLMLYSQSVLDNATRDGARLIEVGKVQNSGSSTLFTDKVCNGVKGLIPCANLQYRVQSSGAFSSMNPAVTVNGSGNMQNTGFSFGTQNQFVLVQVGYKRSYFIPWVGKIVSANNNALLVSTIALQNEPY